MSEEKRDAIITTLEGHLFENTGLMSMWSDIANMIEREADDDFHKWELWTALEFVAMKVESDE